MANFPLQMPITKFGPLTIPPPKSIFQQLLQANNRYGGKPTCWGFGFNLPNYIVWVRKENPSYALRLSQHDYAPDGCLLPKKEIAIPKRLSLQSLFGNFTIRNTSACPINMEPQNRRKIIPARSQVPTKCNHGAM